MSATALDLFLMFPLWPPSSAHSSVSLTSSLFDSVSPLWPLPQPLDHETRQTIQFDFQDSPKGRVHLCPLVLPVLATVRLAPASRPYARSGLPWSSGEGENINYRPSPLHLIFEDHTSPDLAAIPQQSQNLLATPCFDASLPAFYFSCFPPDWVTCLFVSCPHPST